MTNILLFGFMDTVSLVQVMWILGGVVFVSLCILIYRQKVLGARLRNELEEIGKMSQHNVEYEFVLKAMKLATWHLNPTLRTLTFDNDFRDSQGNYVPEAETNIDDWVQHMVPQDRVRVRKALDELCTGQTDVFCEQYEIYSLIPGKTYWEESYATIGERDSDDIPSKVAGASMRIDERKEMETDLILARNKAEESDRLKTAFIANMGHEIRTPLNAIVGFADLLPVVQSDEDRNQLITEIRNNNQKLLRIINGLVSMSEIEAGARSLSISAVDVNELILQIVANYQSVSGLQFETHLPHEQMLIHSDRDVLWEIMDQLMQNAVKFTTEGSIVMGYDIESDQLRIWVKDTGKGIALEDQKRIFERFVKVDEYVPGTGLGLSVVKSHVTHLGGTVGVESELGQGSRFWVLLPIN